VNRTRLLVGALLALALAVRIWEVQRTSYTPANDAQSYLALASQVAHTGDYSNASGPGTGAGASTGPTAYFPPGFPYLLAAVDLIDGHRTPTGAAVHPARIAQAVLGAVGVAAIGLVALEAFGLTVGLISLAIAAIYPVFVELSGTVYSENLLIPLSMASVWAGLKSRHSVHPYRWIVAAGLLGGLSTLTHQNGAVVILGLLGLTCAGTRKIQGPAVLLATAILTIAPWTIRNAIVLHRFIPVSDETGLTLRGTYNPTSAADKQIPYRWLYYKAIPSDGGLYRQAAQLKEPELSSKLESKALHYIGHHPAAPLEVLYHNTRRLLELESSFAWRASTYNIGIPESTARVAVLCFWLVLLLAIIGAFTRVARNAPKPIWAVPLLYYVSVVFINGETPRFRAPIDPFLIILAGCALATVAPWLRHQLTVRQSGVRNSVRA
jgi:4-amino-4-deoxy-L-arabinose transferase-like glycosyltransferase